MFNVGLATGHRCEARVHAQNVFGNWKRFEKLIIAVSRNDNAIE